MYLIYRAFCIADDDYRSSKSEGSKYADSSFLSRKGIIRWIRVDLEVIRYGNHQLWRNGSRDCHARSGRSENIRDAG